MPLRTTLGIFLTLAAAQAQIRELVTTADGAIVYFTAESNGVRILYRADAASVSESPGRRNPAESWSWPDVSSNGLILTAQVSVGDSGGIFWGTADNPLSNRIGSRTYLSSSGEWLWVQTHLIRTFTGQIIRPDVGIPPSQRTTPQRGRRVVAGDGTAVWIGHFGGASPVELAVASLNRPLRTFRRNAREAIIDDAARFVVYVTDPLSGPSSVRELRLDTEADRPLVVADEDVSQPALSGDGRWLMVVTRANFSGRNDARVPQVFVLDRERGGIRQISHDPSGVAEATISGDGRFVWAATLSGRLIKIGVESGEVASPIPSRMSVESRSSPIFFALTPGSLLEIAGRGLAVETRAFAPPLPLEVDGLSVTIDGKPLPFATAGPDRVRLAVPWELADRDYRVEVVKRGQPERSVVAIGRVDPSVPVFLPGVFHGDWSGPVTAERPARNGEIIHLYATGLGPTDVLPPFDQLGPANPPAQLAERFGCGLYTGRDDMRVARYLSCPLYVRATYDLPVLWAGRAPGTIGFYQVTLQLPPEWPNDYETGAILCGLRATNLMQGPCFSLETK